MGQILMSILLGLGLAGLFQQSCHGTDCFEYRGGFIEKVHEKIFTHDDQCYTYNLQQTSCKTDKKKIRMEEVPTSVTNSENK